MKRTKHINNVIAAIKKHRSVRVCDGVVVEKDYGFTWEEAFIFNEFVYCNGRMESASRDPKGSERIVYLLDVDKMTIEDITTYSDKAVTIWRVK
jgi:hypothetical protein